jgi:predicted nucleic acid-binding protein
MTARTFVDTNVWVYAVDGADPEKQQRAQSAIGSLDPASTVISAQVLNEYYVTVTRKMLEPLSQGEATIAVGGIAELEVIPITASLVLGGIDRARDSELSLWDALIVEAARSANCEILLTEDLNADQEFDGLRVSNPFASRDE